MDTNYWGSSTNAKNKVIKMRQDGQKANFFPMRYLIARESTAAPGTIVIRDSQHLSGQYLQGVASGMLTLATGGRCYIGNEPAPAAGKKKEEDGSWQSWHARKTGYEIAYQFATMRARVPCFEVRWMS